jgi:hypothetical protein
MEKSTVNLILNALSLGEESDIYKICNRFPIGRGDE